MKKRFRTAAGALLGAATVATAMISGAGSAFAGTNNSANVSGGVVHRGYCNVGDFCIYTGAGLTGTVFGLPNCGTYSLSNWNGVGSWRNNQTGLLTVDYNLNALVEGVNHNRLSVYNNFPNSTYNGWYDSAQLIGWGDIDFAPVWYVQPCGYYTTN